MGELIKKRKGSCLQHNANKCRRNDGVRKITIWQPYNNSGRNLQWMLKLEGKGVMKNELFL